MQHCHSNFKLIKHYKIQAKFEFGGNSPIFDQVLPLFGLRFRLMQKLCWLFCRINITFLQNYTSGIKGQICKFRNNSFICQYFLLKFRMQSELQLIRNIPNVISNQRSVLDPLGGLRGVGSKRQNSNVSEHDHVAYQIKGKHECSNMVANILPAELRSSPSPDPVVKGQNSTFSEHGQITCQIQ